MRLPTKSIPLVVLAIIALSSALPCFASKDRLGKLSHAELEFEDGGVVTITQNRTHLLSLSFKSADGYAEVPVSDLVDIEGPLIDSMKVTWGKFHDDPKDPLGGVSYRCVHIVFGGNERETFGQKPTAKFYFYDGKYKCRRTYVAIGNGSWQEMDYEPRK